MTSGTANSSIVNGSLVGTKVAEKTVIANTAIRHGLIIARPESIPTTLRATRNTGSSKANPKSTIN